MIERRLENLLALDYPAEKLELVVTSDASTDRTHELVERASRRASADRERARRQGRSAEPRRSGDRRASSSPSPTRTRPGRPTLCGCSSAASPIPRSPTSAAGSCSRPPTARTARASTGATSSRSATAESRLGSITGGNGSIYAVRRSDYVEVDPKWGHDLSFPYRMVQARPARDLRAGGARVREADADERDRVPAQGADVRALLGDRAARLDAARLAAAVSRAEISPTASSATGAGCSTSCCSRLASRSSARAGSTRSALARPAAPARRPPALGVGIARYYVLVTWATLVALWNYLRRGVPATWDAAEGTRGRDERSERRG